MKRIILIAACVAILCGCEALLHKGPELERARAAVAVATANVTAGVMVWQGDLPLEGTAVESEQLSSGAADDDCDCGDDAEFGVYAEPVAEAPVISEPTPGAELPAQATPEVATELKWYPLTQTNILAGHIADRVIWVHTRGDDCPPCDIADNLLADPAVAKAANELNLLAIELNISRREGKPFARAYDVGAVPTDIAIFPDGKYLPYVGLPDDRTAAGYAHRLRSFEHFRGEARWPGYPASSKPGKWKLDGETIDVNHMLTHSKHRDKFNAEWLRQLSRNELLTLHDHDHEPGDKVLWEYVPPPVD